MSVRSMPNVEVVAITDRVFDCHRGGKIRRELMVAGARLRQNVLQDVSHALSRIVTTIRAHIAFLDSVVRRHDVPPTERLSKELETKDLA